jgi:hypothetical protein
LVEVAGMASVKVASALDPKHKAEITPALQRTAKLGQNTETQKQVRELLTKLGAPVD